MKRERLMNLWSQWRPASAVSLIQRSIFALHTALRLVHTGCAAMRARCCIYCEWTLCQVARPAIVDLEWIPITLTTHSIYRLSEDHPLTAVSTLMNDFGLELMQTPLDYPPNYQSFYSMLPGNKWTPQADLSSVFGDFKYFFLPRTTPDMNKPFQQPSNFNLHVFI